MPFQRGENGGATGGKRRGAGRKPEEWKRIVNRALSHAVTEDDLQAAFEIALRYAKSGNLNALNLLLDRMIGRPAQTVDQNVTGAVAVGTMNLDNCTPEELRRRVKDAAEAMLPAGFDPLCEP